MNIKFGMNYFYVRYLKRFLNNELDKNINILGKFDKDDLNSLVQYLNLPNIEDMYVVNRGMSAQFPNLDRLFTAKLGDDEIIYKSRELSQACANFIVENTDAIRDYCETVGWELTDVQEWVDLSKDINGDGVVNQLDANIIYEVSKGEGDYDLTTRLKCDLNLDDKVDDQDIEIMNDYLQNNRLTIHISKSKRTNHFPNKDMLVFINQFEGDFIYGYTIIGGNSDDGTPDGTPHKDRDKLHKIALYRCKPGQKITIAHNNTKATELVIGCSAATMRTNIKSMPLTNIVKLDGTHNPLLKPGQGYQYTCSNSAKWVVIQCPSNYNSLVGGGEITVTLTTGDINFDGKVDMLDYHLLAQYTAEGPGSTDLPMNKAHWTPTDRQLAVMNVNKDAAGVTNEDAVMMWRFLNGLIPSITSLGLTPYTYTDPNVTLDIDNVNNLLIIDGHYYNYNENTGKYEDGFCVNGSVNIPFDDFVDDDWVIHEKFFNYLLDMAIHIYSTDNDITYVQNLLKKYYPEHAYNKEFFYPGTYSNIMKTLITNFQKSKVHYTTGDLNNDDKVDEHDLTLLRQYVQDTETLRLVTKYLNNEIELTEEQIAAIDRDGDNDGKVTVADKEVIQKKINAKYSNSFQTNADINGDDIVDEQDVALLEQILQNEEVSGVNLAHYDIPFMLGWCDVETEASLEYTVNADGNISEVSK